MLEIQVSLSPETLSAVNGLANALRITPQIPGPFAQQPQMAAQQAPPVIAPPQTLQQPLMPPPPVMPPQAPPVMAPPPVVAQPAWSQAALFDMAQQLVSQFGKINELNQLINGKFGVPALDMVPQERYSEIANDMMALGAKPPAGR